MKTIKLSEWYTVYISISAFYKIWKCMISLFFADEKIMRNKKK